jgi:glycerol-3-phosphate dehydrogenase
LNSAAALKMAPLVAQVMANELNRDEHWQKDQVAQFTKLAKQYMVSEVLQPSVS